MPVILVFASILSVLEKGSRGLPVRDSDSQICLNFFRSRIFTLDMYRYLSKLKHRMSIFYKYQYFYIKSLKHLFVYLKP